MTRKISTSKIVYKDKVRKQKEDRDFFYYLIKGKMGELLRNFRKKNGLSQKCIDVETGISERTISDIETGKGCSLEIIIKVFQYYHHNNYITKEEYDIFHYYHKLFIKSDPLNNELIKTLSPKTTLKNP